MRCIHSVDRVVKLVLHAIVESHGKLPAIFCTNPAVTPYCNMR